MYLTGIFKLCTTRRKREIIDHALSEYAALRSWLLTYAEQKIDRLEAEARVERKSRTNYPVQRLQNLLPSVRECPGALHGGLKNAARRDVAVVLSTYLIDKHLGRNPGFPSVTEFDKNRYVAALKDLGASADLDQAALQDLITNLFYAAREPSRWQLNISSMNCLSTNQGGLLLVDPSTQKYYALVFLLPRGHDLRETLDTRGNLVPVGTESMDPFTLRPTTAILCPLEFGEWQRVKFLSSGAVPRRAWLRRDRQGDYYLGVDFEMPKPEPVELTGAVMSVVGSAAGFVAYTVVDSGGRVLESGDYCEEALQLRSLRGEFSAERRRRQRRGQSIVGLSLLDLTKDVVHQVANDLVGRAVKYGARVVTQSPKRRGKARATQRARQLQGYDVFPVTRLQAAVRYKTEMAGLPSARWARMWREGELGDKWIYLGRVCADCGSVVSKGEPGPVFPCPTCGDRDYVDNLGKVVALSAI